MQHPRHLRIEDFSYELPDERIARYPLAQRDASKLLVFGREGIREQTFTQLPEEIPAGTLLVYNQTKVVHARLLFRKPTGGVVEVFCLEPEERYASVPIAMQQQGAVYWKCLVGGAGKWKPGMALNMEDPESGLLLSATVAERRPGSFVIRLAWDQEHVSFADVLQRLGKVPLPPYLQRDAEDSDESRYQTIFARQEGSVAAPTAALHFTEDVLQRLREKGVDSASVTLHVGAGTFRPVKSETMEEHDMHAEWIEADATLVRRLIGHLEQGIVAIGTTSMRTLESLYWIGCRLLTEKNFSPAGIAVPQWFPYELREPVPVREALEALLGWLEQQPGNKLVTRTQIIIAPGYVPRIVKGLITNFHQPQSTLLLLVAALIGDEWKRVYDYAMGHDFRFLSYGDSGLLWRNVEDEF